MGGKKQGRRDSPASNVHCVEGCVDEIGAEGVERVAAESDGEEVRLGAIRT